ncbi:hypothetical protein [Sphingomonas sp.]|jgi:hypothetical protein|uniref:hypothetical protein n=1 Tax=Sphingomonas sp. TaxID=28214 RepID=UPI002DC00049|nr:hypothetical protein [Sphingomonas sp.]HEU4968922.1 hypothetical protein [Sphingomonas sp.]
MNRIEKISWAIALLAVAEPAVAGIRTVTPAPAIGLGIGAVALMGFGYRALKSRIRP